MRVGPFPIVQVFKNKRDYEKIFYQPYAGSKGKIWVVAFKKSVNHQLPDFSDYGTSQSIFLFENRDIENVCYSWEDRSLFSWDTRILRLPTWQFLDPIFLIFGHRVWEIRLNSWILLFCRSSTRVYGDWGFYRKPRLSLNVLREFERIFGIKICLILYHHQRMTSKLNYILTILGSDDRRLLLFMLWEICWDLELLASRIL